MIPVLRIKTVVLFMTFRYFVCICFVKQPSKSFFFVFSIQWLTVQNLWQHLEEVFSHSGTAKVKIGFEVPAETLYLFSYSHP